MVQQMGLPNNMHCCDGGSGNRKCAGQRHRWEHTGSLCSPPSFLSQQHMGAKWGQCALHMLARSHPSSQPPITHTHTHKHTHCTRGRTLDHQSWLGDEEKGDASINRCLALLFWRGLCFFSLPLKSVVCVCCCSPCLAWKCSAILAGFIYLQVLEWEGLDLVSRASGTWAGGWTSLEWVCGLNVFPLGFTLLFLLLLCGGLWCCESDIFHWIYSSHIVLKNSTSRTVVCPAEFWPQAGRASGEIENELVSFEAV